MIAKGLNQVTIDSTFSSTEANTETLSGASRYKLPIMRVNVPSGQDVKKITMPAGVNLKKVIVNVDGNVTGLNNETGEYLIKNDTTLTPTLSGSGTISARKIQDFNWPVSSYKLINLLGGYSGANGSAIAYKNPSLSDGDPTTAFSSGPPSILIQRESNQGFRAYWTFNTQDYKTFPSGSVDVSGAFSPWINTDGTMKQPSEDSDSVEFVTYVNGNGRDARAIQLTSLVKNGNRIFLFGTNNKNPSGISAEYMQGWSTWANWKVPGPPADQPIGLTAAVQYNVGHDAGPQIGVNELLDGYPISTSVVDTSFTGTINGDPNK
tara:strand:+ start:831 stop:1793 length:963 start_codon:yes stop_codon:yes gene_type:complete